MCKQTAKSVNERDQIKNIFDKYLLIVLAIVLSYMSMPLTTNNKTTKK